MGNSNWARLAWGITTIVLAIVLYSCLSACHGTFPFTPNNSKQTLTTASQQASDNSKAVAIAATQVSGTAQEVVKDATAGKAATPVNLLSVLGAYWDRIAANGAILMQQGANLQTISQQITGLQTQIDTGTKQAEAERSAMQKTIAAQAKEIAAANSRTQHMLEVISVLAIVAIGVGVAIAVWLKDFHLASAVVIGGIVVVASCILLGEIDRYKVQILIGLCVAAAIVTAFEIWRYRATLLAPVPAPKAGA